LATTAAPASDTLFRAAADQAPQVMWIVNVKGAVTYLNQAWYQLVGGQAPKWYGHEWADVVDPEDVLQMRDRWSAASATGSIFEGTRRVKAQDGTWHTLAYKATPVFENGQATCWIGMDADITELMAAQAALRVANQELEAFSYSVSHDLRAPLVTVQGFSRTLVRQLGASADPKVLHSVERISESIEYLGRLVDGLLALSHVTRMKLRQEEVDLSPMASDILERLQRSQPERVAVVTVQPELRARCLRAAREPAGERMEIHVGDAAHGNRLRPRGPVAAGLHVLREGQRRGFRHGAREAPVQRFRAAARRRSIPRHGHRPRHGEPHRPAARRASVGRFAAGPGRMLLFHVALPLRRLALPSLGL
jgi:PAS domain S-box-containing protein